jgi:hypothetical protein
LFICKIKEVLERFSRKFTLRLFEKFILSLQLTLKYDKVAGHCMKNYKHFSAQLEGKSLNTGVPFVVFLSTQALSNEQPATIATSNDCCHHQGLDKRNTIPLSQRNIFRKQFIEESKANQFIF